MARRHSAAEYHAVRAQQHPEQGEQGSSSSDQWWDHGRAQSPPLFSEEYHYNSQDRRGSAPNFFLQPDGGYAVSAAVFPAPEPTVYTTTSQPLASSSRINLPPRSSIPAILDLPSPVHRVASHRGRSHHNDPALLQQSLGHCSTSIRDGHNLDQHAPRPPPPPAALGLPLNHISRQVPLFENEPPPSVDDTTSPISSPQGTTSPSNSGSDSPLRGPLETCQLDEPGCYVLVPFGTNRDDSTGNISITKSKDTRKVMSGRGTNRRRTDETERQAIRRNRKNGVCIRCKIYKEKCRGGIPCDRCRTLKLWKSICVPAQFKERAVFNRVIYQDRVVSLINNIQFWNAGATGSADSDGEVFEVHNGYAPTLRLTAHRFVPHDANLLQHIVWRVPGSPDFNRLPSTSYGLKGEVSAETFDDYLDKHVQCVIASELRPSSDEVPIVASTMRAAQEYAQGNKNLSVLVKKALRIWVAQTFFFRRSWRIWGANTLGMTPIKVDGLIPLPRLINQQLDAQLEFRVATLERELLADLQAHILDRNSTDWFGIFLTIFIHLSSLERDTWCLNTWEHDGPTLQKQFHQLNLQNSHPDPSKAFLWPLRVSPTILIGKNNNLAGMLVSHFRTVSRGFIPFTAEWDQRQAVQVAGNEKEAVEYMKAMSQQVPKFESEQYLASRQAAEYSREDCDSLSGMFTAKLMINDHLE